MESSAILEGGSHCRQEWCLELFLELSQTSATLFMYLKKDTQSLIYFILTLPVHVNRRAPLASSITSIKRLWSHVTQYYTKGMHTAYYMYTVLLLVCSRHLWPTLQMLLSLRILESWTDPGQLITQFVMTSCASQISWQFMLCFPFLLTNSASLTLGAKMRTCVQSRHPTTLGNWANL